MPSLSSQPKSLPDLPPEILHEVWMHALCPHGGINLHIDHAWIPKLLRRGPPPSPSPHYDSPPQSPASDLSSEEEDIGADDGFHRALRALQPLQVAILRISRSTYNECLPLLYNKNRFTFHTDAATIMWWLRARSARQRSLIRYLGLSKRSIFTPAARSGNFDSLCDLIAEKMDVESITIWAPRDEDLRAIKTDSDRDTTSHKWHRCAYDLRRLLRDRKFAELRLMFARDDYERRDSLDFNTLGLYYKPFFLPKELDLNSICMVKILNRALDFETVEPLARTKFDAAHMGLPPSAYLECSQSFEDYITSLRLQKKRTLDVSREDCCGVDEGTVAVLRLNPSVDEDWICQNRTSWEGSHRGAITM